MPRLALRPCAAASVLPIMRAKVTALHRARRPAGGRRFFAVRNLQRKTARDNGFLATGRARRRGVQQRQELSSRQRLCAAGANRPRTTHTSNALIGCYVSAYECVV